MPDNNILNEILEAKKFTSLLTFIPKFLATPFKTDAQAMFEIWIHF